ncbi:hypothetical protein HanPI659440_Chr00c07g0717131 [Helianthus annuus]|nr:hypothetical protein HanPI659440_Chr00c07g0717131 [Helianthus annuus]
MKVFFFWLNTLEVYRTDYELGFSIGIASAGFPIDNFKMCSQCGCEMDCDGVSGRDRGKGVLENRSNGFSICNSNNPYRFLKLHITPLQIFSNLNESCFKLVISYK